MASEYLGPNGNFAEMVAVEQDVRAISTPESRTKLTELGVKADRLSNRAIDPEAINRPEIRKLELQQIVDALQQAVPLVESLRELIDEHPIIASFITLDVRIPNFSAQSGNRISSESAEKIMNAVG